MLGSGRGVTDPRAIAQRLTDTERELGQLHAQLGSVSQTNERLRREYAELNDEVARLHLQLGDASSEIAMCSVHRDIARYAAMRAGGVDPLAHSLFEEEHHDIWTAGRPYLTGQHVYEPQTGACYRAKRGGVSAGARPGQSSHWHLCTAGICPEPEPIPATPHPVGGLALRQTAVWWDRERHAWRLEQLTPEHLVAVISWLRESAEWLYQAELNGLRLYVPCPTWAYPSPRAWLADTPLMGALLAERRRRRRRGDIHILNAGRGPRGGSDENDG